MPIPAVFASRRDEVAAVSSKFQVAWTEPNKRNYATADGVARQASDYVARSGTLNFPAGTTSKTVSVAITGDTTVEGDETLLVLLSGAVNASVSKARGIGTIRGRCRRSKAGGANAESPPEATSF